MSETSGFDNQLLRLAQFHQIKISFIIMREIMSADTFKLDQVAKLSGGSSQVLQHKVGIPFYMDLLHAFTNILESNTQNPIIVHSNHIGRPEGSRSHGTLIIDAYMGKDTKFGIFVQDTENHFIKSVMFYNEMGTKFGPFATSSTWESVNMKGVLTSMNEICIFDEVSK